MVVGGEVDGDTVPSEGIFSWVFSISSFPSNAVTGVTDCWKEIVHALA